MTRFSRLNATRRFAGMLAAVLASAMFVSGCGGGDGDSTNTPAIAETTAAIEGAVTGPDGSRVVGATVTLTSTSRSSVSTTTDAEGKYRLTKLGLDDRWIVRVESNGMASLLRPVATRSNQTTSEDFALYAEGVRTQISATDAATVTDTASGARLDVPTNAWRREDGAAISGPLTVSITSVSPELAASRMPGDFTTLSSTGQVSQIESFGAVNITVVDSTGQRVNLANGAVAQMRIPASSRGELPATVGLYSLDETTGRWKDEGTATLAGSGSNRWYEASVTHLSSWNADQPLNTVFVQGCLLNDQGQPAVGRSVIAEGLDYSARTGEFTNSEGRFRIAVKRGGLFRIEMQRFPLQTGAVTITPLVAGPSDVDIQITTCLQERVLLDLAPVIVQQPANVAVIEDSNVRFDVVVDGAQPLRYQWQKDGVDIPGARGPVLIQRGSLADNGSLFKVKVSNSLGTVTSNEARLTVAPVPVIAPGISTQPVDRTVPVGGVGLFSVVATGSAPLSYQWYRNGVALVGETSAELRFTAVLADSGATFSVTVSNSGGSITSRVATLTIQNPAAGAPVIASEPSPVNAIVGETARFSVVAQGEAPLAYQWQRNGVAIAGANAASYSLVTTLTDSGSRFSVVVSNGRGSALSVGVDLTVIQPRLTGTLTVSGDAAVISNGTFTPSSPNSNLSLSGPNCVNDFCNSELLMNGFESERTQVLVLDKVLNVVLLSRSAIPGVAPGIQPTFARVFLNVSRFDALSPGISLYSNDCPASQPNCKSVVDEGVAVDPVQRTITFTNATLYKDQSAAITTLNGVLRY